MTRVRYLRLVVVTLMNRRCARTSTGLVLRAWKILMAFVSVDERVVLSIQSCKSLSHSISAVAACQVRHPAGTGYMT